MSESREWEEIIIDTQIMSFEKIGDSIEGIYIKKEENVGKWDKTRYTVEVDGTDRFVYGTTDLNEKFKQIPEGYEVQITLKKCIPSKPPKKPYKVFTVCKRPALKLDNSIQDVDDSEARTTIEMIQKEVGDNATPEEIVQFAEKNQAEWELTDEEISRIKIQAVKMRS